MSARSAIGCLLLLAAGSTACLEQDDPPASTPAAPAAPPEPPGEVSTARPELVEGLRADLAAERHRSDGGGRAWLEEGAGPVEVGARGSWTIVYEAGPEGVADGGAVLLKVSPFWGWSDPQDAVPERPGFTTVESVPPDVAFTVEKPDRQVLAARLGPGGLAPGGRLRFVYGAGPAGARADGYAERASAFWIAVDGDGDGVSALIEESPAVEVLAGPPVRLWLTLQSTARPGEPVRLAAALLDGAANAARGTGPVALLAAEAAPEGLELPPELVLAEDGLGAGELVFPAPAAGVLRVTGRFETSDGRVLEAESNPLVVGGGPSIQWGDLHGHSSLSDGTGLPEEWYRYARDVAALDVVSLTDHDHWGMVFLDRSPRVWEEIRHWTEAYHEPGRFVTLLGFEWTSWVFGHRHVLWFDEGAGEGREVLSSIDERWDDPRELWDALRGEPAVTIPHHPAGGPIAIDWSVPPDPELEPVVEVVSAHGSSEAFDSPVLIYSAVEGRTARDALDRGYRLGFVGSGDGHDGHPGLTHLGPAYPTGGVVAIVGAERTRAGVLQALRERRVYATSGPRIVLRCALSGHPMGSSVPAAELGPTAALYLSAVATAPILRVDLIRSGSVIDSLAGGGQRELSLTAELRDLAPGEYVYVRLVEARPDGRAGGLAWTSPFFVDGPAAAPADVTR